MMNKNFTKLTAVLLFAAGAVSTVQAQYQKLGDNPFTLDASAALEIATGADSTVPSKGFLPPRLTDAQQGAVAGPATGLMVYNTTKNALMLNVGTSANPNWKAAATSTAITYATKQADYTLTADDYTILGDATKAITLTLPAVGTSTGKIYIVGKLDATTANTVTFSPALRLSKGVTVSVLNYPKTFRIQSDGTSWNIID